MSNKVGAVFEIGCALYVTDQATGNRATLHPRPAHGYLGEVVQIGAGQEWIYDYLVNQMAKDPNGSVKHARRIMSTEEIDAMNRDANVALAKAGKELQELEATLDDYKHRLTVANGMVDALTIPPTSKQRLAAKSAVESFIDKLGSESGDKGAINRSLKECGYPGQVPLALGDVNVKGWLVELFAKREQAMAMMSAAGTSEE